MNPADIIARLDALRTSWLELPDGKRVQIVRPLETQVDALSGHRGLATLAEALCVYVVGWEGFTEADLFGSALGSSDALAFDAALFLRVTRDRADYVLALGQEVRRLVTAHREAKATATKN